MGLTDRCRYFHQAAGCRSSHLSGFVRKSDIRGLHGYCLSMSDTTALLLCWNSGDQNARNQLMDRVYRELEQIAARHLSNESSAHRLLPHALVHEAYIRLVDMNRVDWQDRAHFMGVAATIMRQVLIDQARKRRAAKRDGGVQVTLSGVSPKVDPPSADVLMLHEALEDLAAADPDRARLVELRFFGGMTIEETAKVLGRSPATVKRQWEVARGWLYRTMRTEI